jgi:carbon monoxide dehydrogenase subunit G
MVIETDIVLPCPAKEAWDVLVDWERQADWMLDADRVEVVSSQREGVGVRLVVKTRILGIPAFTEPMEVTDWEPPRWLTIRHGALVRGAGAWTLTPVDEGTTFTWTEDVRLAVPVVGGLAARLYAPVMRRLMTRAMAGLRASIVARGPRRA